MMRVVLDVNVVVSAVLAPNGTPHRLIQAWRLGAFFLITSAGIIAEVEDKLRSPRVDGAYGVSADDVRAVGTLLRTQAEMAVVPREAVVVVTNDPEDDYVLATAVAGTADYLVTGDRRMLALSVYQGIRIVSPRESLDMLPPDE